MESTTLNHFFKQSFSFVVSSKKRILQKRRNSIVFPKSKSKDKRVFPQKSFFFIHTKVSPRFVLKKAVPKRVLFPPKVSLIICLCKGKHSFRTYHSESILHNSGYRSFFRKENPMTSSVKHPFRPRVAGREGLQGFVSVFFVPLFFSFLNTRTKRKNIQTNHKRATRRK